ncbi:uncharacterized protein LOC143561553 [Bidens hawaiensis]|uniref:uncharacterized protein LOC143561553 n=1 Tax=Bidens hawaiensis TaxID=980011 RepID=UPI004048EC62
MVMEEGRSRSPPKPKSPPPGGKQKQLSKVVNILETQIHFLHEELKSIETLQPASFCIKEVTNYAVANPEPLITVRDRKTRKSRGFWKWLCCFDMSCVCCKGCSVATLCCCSLPDCCSCSLPKCKPPACPSCLKACLCCPKCTCSCKCCWPTKCSGPKCSTCCCSSSSCQWCC